MHVRITFTLAAFALLFMAMVRYARAHGSMVMPIQRGATSSRSPIALHPMDDDSEVDYFMHFPAGDKSVRPGSGVHSQERAAGRAGWTPYEPTNRGFVWRAGVCGDMVRGNDHLRGGKYYNDGKISATYSSGGVIDVELAVTAHHNGFVEVYVCDVDKCPGGEISPRCF